MISDVHIILRHSFSLLVLNFIWFTFPCFSYCQDVRSTIDNGAASIYYLHWTDPAPIPIELENQTPWHPQAVFRNDTLFLAFETHAVHGPEKYLAQDVYVMQYHNGSWSIPVNVSRSSASSAHPRLALTGAGPVAALHLIWGEQVTPESRLAGPPRPIAPDAVFYAAFKNGSWTRPRSLFQINKRSIQFPYRLIRDGESSLHFIFSAPDPINKIHQIFYIQKQKNTDTWSIPGHIGSGFDPDLIRLEDNRLLMVYTRADSAWARRVRGRDVNSIFVKRSVDGGVTWSKDFLVQRSGSEPAYSPHLATDGKGNVHLFWQQDVDGDRWPDTICHAYSADDTTWTAAKELLDTEKLTEGYPISFEMTGTPDGNIHAIITWGKGPGSFSSELFYTWWDGTRWQRLQPLFNFQLTGLPRLLYDEGGDRLHLLFRAGTEKEQHLYHSVAER